MLNYEFYTVSTLIFSIVSSVSIAACASNGCIVSKSSCSFATSVWVVRSWTNERKNVVVWKDKLS